MGKRFIKRDPHTNPSGIPESGRFQCLLISLVPYSEQDQLDVSLQQLIQHHLDEIETFLRSQPRDDGQNGNVRILRKIEELLQISLAGLLARKVVRTEIL